VTLAVNPLVFDGPFVPESFGLFSLAGEMVRPETLSQNKRSYSAAVLAALGGAFVVTEPGLKAACLNAAG
jgi:hypothetical protein